MADWKQITARIRRARTSKDPVAQLSALYEKTRDAMVAFELGKSFENSGQKTEAARWYSTAAEKFRRADWKTRAQEAAVRLGGQLGETTPDTAAKPAGEFLLTPPGTAPQEEELPFARNPEAMESVVAISSEIQQAAKDATSAPPETAKRRPRGRRGGRNRRRGPATSETAGASIARESRSGALRELPPVAIPVPDESTPLTVTHSRVMPSLPPEPLGEFGGSSVKGRYGDPGLASRISLLEMQFRRLLACPPAQLSEADHAPAGPGVFVLTDSELTSYYYVEACQTLRVAISNLSRSGASRRGADSIKPRLAKHLGIAESRVSKYLADHCVVRWLQLDEGASNFAHFAIAVLRPTLNE